MSDLDNMWSLDEEFHLLYEDDAVERAEEVLAENPELSEVELEEFRPANFEDIPPKEVADDVLHFLEEYFYEHDVLSDTDDADIGAIFRISEVPDDLRARLQEVLREITEHAVDLSGAAMQPTHRCMVVTRKELDTPDR